MRNKRETSEYHKGIGITPKNPNDSGSIKCTIPIPAKNIGIPSGGPPWEEVSVPPTSVPGPRFDTGGGSDEEVPSFVETLTGEWAVVTLNLGERSVTFEGRVTGRSRMHGRQEFVEVKNNGGARWVRLSLAYSVEVLPDA